MPRVDTTSDRLALKNIFVDEFLSGTVSVGSHRRNIGVAHQRGSRPIAFMRLLLIMIQGRKTMDI